MHLRKELRLNFKNNVAPKELRKFGFLIGGIFLLCGFFNIFHFTVSFFYLGLLVIVLALVWPASLDIFYRVWMSLGTILGFFISHIILIFLYCCIITPVGYIMRLLKQDPIDKNIEKNLKTYWTPHTDD